MGGLSKFCAFFCSTSSKSGQKTQLYIIDTVFFSLTYQKKIILINPQPYKAYPTSPSFNNLQPGLASQPHLVQFWLPFRFLGFNSIFPCFVHLLTAYSKKPNIVSAALVSSVDSASADHGARINIVTACGQWE
jgi:hypothetical protein